MNLPVRKYEGIPSLSTDFNNLASSFVPNYHDLDRSALPVQLGINMPTANLYEDRWVYKVDLAAPGLERNDFNIEVENRTLRIIADKETDQKELAGDYFRKEFSFTTFCRTFTLPENIMEESIRAEYENGILKVVIPKLKETPLKPVYKIAVS